jgi:hypothetical protein
MVLYAKTRKEPFSPLFHVTKNWSNASKLGAMGGPKQPFRDEFLEHN